MAGQGPAPLPHIGLLLDAPAITGTFGKTLGLLTSTGVGGVLVAGTTNQQFGQLILEAAGGGGDGVAYLVKTLDALTSTGAGTVTLSGSVGKTLGGIGLSTTGGPSIVGGFTKTLNGVTFSAGASVGVGANQGGDAAPLPSIGLLFYPSLAYAGSLSKTLGILTCVSAAFVDEPAGFDYDDIAPIAKAYYKGALDVDWMQSDTVVREDSGGLTGVLGKTLGPIGIGSGGTVTIDAVFSKTLGAVTTLSAGTVTVSATLAKTLADLSCNAAASVDANYVATLAQTLGVLTSSGAGTIGVGADLVRTLGAMTSSGAGTVSGGNYIAGLTRTLGSLTVDADARLDVDATLGIVLGPLTGTIESTAYSGFVAILNKALGPLTSTGAGNVFQYELGVRRRWTAKATERRIGSSKARATEREIEGELVE